MSRLAGKDRRALRALGHHLSAVIQIGQQGITAALIEASKEALASHELIKVKVLEGAPLDRKDAAAKLAEETGAEVAQILGRTILLYKRNPDAPKIELGVPPKAALHGHVGGEGDRPAAGKAGRAITQGAADEAAAVQAPRKRGPAFPRPSVPSRTANRGGTGAKLPPRRHSPRGR